MSDALAQNMPAPEEILALLISMTRELSWLAIVWHLLLLSGLSCWLAHAPFQARVIGALLIGLPLSVAAAAAAFDNPFNAAAFGVLAAALAAAHGLRRMPSTAPSWAPWIGAALLLYGWCYPHFVTGPWYRSLYASPLGVVPCPTLAVLAGLTLLASGRVAGAAPTLLALWTTFYALFGIFRLGVYLDAGLLVASAALLACRFATSRARGKVASATSAAHRRLIG